MIEVKIPPEITQYDPKIVGPFSMRQTFCGSAAIGISYLIYHFFHTAMNQEELVAAIMVISIPFGLLGWVRPYGMRFEKYFFGVLLHSLLHPTKRYYANGNSSGTEVSVSELSLLAIQNHETEKKATRKISKGIYYPQAAAKSRKAYRKQTFL